MEQNSLIIFTKASQMLAEANTIQKAKELKDLALTAADWAKRKNMGEEAIRYAKSYAIRAEIKLGELLKATERARGKRTDLVSSSNQVDKPTLTELGLTKKESSEAQLLASLPKEIQEEVVEGKLTKADVKREIKRKEIIKKLESIKAKKTNPILDEYDVIVIDPPWPIQKIERDVTPNQVGMDYPVMTEEEIHNLKIPHAKDCHIWIWTTQKFLPSAFKMIENRRFKYICTFVWHKPGGFQPFELPQYNCEFILYCRVGSPKFVDTKDFFTCFEAPRGKHSEKPEKFYQMIRRVTAGKRLDMFGRRKIDGFDSWGNEI